MANLLNIKSLTENNNELIYTALYSRQGESLESYTAKRSVISNSDMAYEWYKTVDFDIVQNDKYLGVIVSWEEKKFISSCGAYDLIYKEEKFYIKISTVNYIESLTNWKHQLNTLRKNFTYII